MVDQPHWTQALPGERRRQLRRIVKRPIWGNMRRMRPFSDTFGFDRGTPIDRFYMRRFIGGEAEAIRGVAGEIAGADYLEEFGGGKVDQVDIIDIDDTNPRATVIADLSLSGSLASESFDCLVVAQTLQYAKQPEAALTTCLDALSPGGTLLLAVPALAPHDLHEPEGNDHWRFWPAGVEGMLRRLAPDMQHKVRGYGNLVAALAFMHGLSAEELRQEELLSNDPRFPIVVCARSSRTDVGGRP